MLVSKPDNMKKLVLVNLLLLGLVSVCEFRSVDLDNEVLSDKNMNLDLELRPPSENSTNVWAENITTEQVTGVELTPPEEGSKSVWDEAAKEEGGEEVFENNNQTEIDVELQPPRENSADNFNHWDAYLQTLLHNVNILRSSLALLNTSRVNLFRNVNGTSIVDTYLNLVVPVVTGENHGLDLELKPPKADAASDWDTPEVEDAPLTKSKKVEPKKYQGNEIIPTDYCKVCNTHTVCQHPKCELSGNCTLVNQLPLTKSEKNLILHHHNKLRSQIALGEVSPHPGATNMNQLVWDNELEYISQCWANQCKFEHDDCRDTPTEKVGQNIVYHGSTLQDYVLNESLEGMIDDWFNEYRDFPVEFIPTRPYPNPTFTNHYTQLVWAKTERIGCARVYAYQNPFYTVYLYCNYSPRGNNAYEGVYNIGEAASQCAENGRIPSRDYKGLCA